MAVVMTAAEDRVVIDLSVPETALAGDDNHDEGYSKSSRRKNGQEEKQSKSRAEKPEVVR